MTFARLWVLLECLALAAGVVLAHRRRAAGAVGGAAVLVLPACAVHAAMLALERFVGAEVWYWNAARLLPAFLLGHGLPLYPEPDAGPLLGYVKGPVFPLLFLPATVAATPRVALPVGLGLAAAYFFAPVAWLHATRVPGPPAARRLVGAWSFLAFVLWVFTSEGGLAYSAFSIHADAPALGLAALSCILLLASDGAVRPGVGPALAAVLAVWCKQVAAPLLAAEALFVLLVVGGRAALRYLALVLAAGLVVTAAVAVWFRGEALWFHMFVLPARIPLRTGGSAHPVGGALLELARQAAPMLLLAAAGLGAGRSFGVRDGSLRAPFLLLLVGAAMVPTAILGWLKRGGGDNSFTFVLYFVGAAATLLVARAATLAAAEDRTSRALAGLALAVTVGASIAVTLPDEERLADAGEHVRTVVRPPEHVAYDYLRAHPGRVYFPWNPLAHLLAEGRVHHFGYAVIERRAAGLGASPEQLRAHVPERFDRIAFQPKRQTEQVRASWLREFSRRIEDPELPGWSVYVRDPARPR